MWYNWKTKIDRDDYKEIENRAGTKIIILKLDGVSVQIVDRFGNTITTKKYPTMRKAKAYVAGYKTRN